MRTASMNKYRDGDTKTNRKPLTGAHRALQRHIIMLFEFYEIQDIIKYFNTETKLTVADYYLENERWLVVELRGVNNSFRMKFLLLD